MSFDVNWSIDKYRDDHESEEHWQLRRDFMEKWKSNYPEERLVCLARAFTNIEFMGCRYPKEVMEEVGRLCGEVVQPYRKIKKTRLQRTFVSASDAAEDRAKGIKREGGVIKENPTKKTKTIAFIAQGATTELPDSEPEIENIEEKVESKEVSERVTKECINIDEFVKDMSNIRCLSVRDFREYMFESRFGRLVLIVRPWARMFVNIQTSCQACGAIVTSSYDDGLFSLTINGTTVAQATGDSKTEARNAVEILAWERLRKEAVCVLMKEQFIAQGSTISVSEVSKQQPDIFGTPIENSVATKMMQLMGWKGGGLGADSQGIAEPIKPNMQMVNRAGLGSQSDVRHFRRAALSLMQRFIASDAFDLDLIFSSDFSKDERAVLHQCAKRAGLASRSYGGDKDRFLVVKKKLDPFSLARAVIQEGGTTPKYQVFIPAVLASR